MTKLQHAQVLRLYLDRLTLADLQAIMETKRRSMHAAMNLGSRAQAIYAEDEERTIGAAVSKLLPSDLRNIEAGLSRLVCPPVEA